MYQLHMLSYIITNNLCFLSVAVLFTYKFYSNFPAVIVKASSGPRYVVGCRNKVDKEKLTSGTRVALDMTTLTIMRALPREVDPVVYNMLHEDPGNVSYSAVGGLSDQIRELRESIELPLMNPELFLRVGIKPPKVVYRPYYLISVLDRKL